MVKRKASKKKPGPVRRKASGRRRKLTTQQDDLFGAVFVLPMAGIALGATSRF